MKHSELSLLAALALASACADTRPYSELMADAAADIEAIRFESALHRFDSARTAAPRDTEAHRQYAMLAAYFELHATAAEAWEHVLELEPRDATAWDGYFFSLYWAGAYESDRRYGEKLLQVLPEALQDASWRPELYSNAQSAAAQLGQLEAYNAILMGHSETEADNPVFMHHLGAAQLAIAKLAVGDQWRVVRDSLVGVLAELAARNQDNTETEAAMLYRLAAGYQFLWNSQKDLILQGPEEQDLLLWEQLGTEMDLWLSRLLAAPDRGILAVEMRYWDLVEKFVPLRYRVSEQDSRDELFRIVNEGMNTPTLWRRAAWVNMRVLAILAMADQSLAEEATQGDEPVSLAAEPQMPGLAPEYAEPLFEAVMELIAWQRRGPGASTVSALESLLHYGIEPQRVLGEAISLEEALRADRPGYLYAGDLGEARERSRQSVITSARVLQARALAQLGEIEAAGELFEELATESPRGETLAQLGRHLMRTNQPERALDMLVEALAHGGDWRQAAEEAAAAAGLANEVVDERLAERQPIVRAELDRRALGERLERRPPDLALPDQNGVEWALRDLTGKVVVLKFWATWCGPCLQEFPHFVELLETYEDDDEVVFLTVASAGSSREGVAQLLSERGYTFPVLLDDEGRADDFEVLVWPTTLYLDPSGLIQFKREGFSKAGYEHQTAIRIEALRRSGGALE